MANEVEPNNVKKETSPFFLTVLVGKIRDIILKLLRSGPLGPYLVQVHKWWHGLSPFRRHFTENLLVAVVITLALQEAGNLPWLRNMEDQAMDWMMRLYAGTEPAREETPAYVALDISEDAYEAWGEPPHVPRDKLAQLIEFAIKASPRLLIVDIDLSRPSPKDQAVADLFRRLAKEAAAREVPFPPVILARALREPRPEKGRYYRMERPSFMDGVLAEIGEGKLDVRWASVLYSLDADRTIRRWRLWELTCDQQGNGGAILSVQLAALAVLKHGSGGLKTIQKEMDVRRPDCSRSPNDETTKEDSTAPFSYFGLRIGGNDFLGNRIVYEIPWHTPGGGGSHAVRPDVKLENKRVPLIDFIPAQAITEATTPVSSEGLKGRVVVIGTSHYDGRDIHPTPIGDMPGYLVIFNSLHSLFQHGSVTSSSIWIKVALEVLAVAVISYLFVIFHSFWGMVASGVVVLALMLPVSFWLFKTGVWLDFAIPLFGVQLHQMAEEFQEGRRRRTGAGNPEKVTTTKKKRTKAKISTDRKSGKGS